jgi:hypothetical protein
VWRRSWQSVARFPLPRLARIAGLGALAALSLGGVLRGSTPLAMVAALALLYSRKQLPPVSYIKSIYPMTSAGLLLISFVSLSQSSVCLWKPKLGQR